MKKSLLALAVLGAAASAQAADISLYGVVDTGLAYPEFCTSLFDPHEEAFSLRNSLNYEGLSGEIDDAA